MVKRAQSRDGGPRKIRYFRMSDAEWAHMIKLAESCDPPMTASAFIRRMTLGNPSGAGMAVSNEHHSDGEYRDWPENYPKGP